MDSLKKLVTEFEPYLDAEVNVTDHRPSVVAAAAVLAAGRDHNLTKKMLEKKIDDVPSWGPVEKVKSFFWFLMLYCKRWIELTTDCVLFF